jgi:predicted amidohydrolase YtcJ
LDKNRWGDAFPNRQHLDEVAPENPVALTTRDGHSLWVNSLALKRCGIGAGTRAPAGGRILRDRRGHPTGILLEAATGLVRQSPGFARPRAVPPSSDLVRALRSLLRLGITSVHLMEEAPLLHPLQDLRESGDLCLRVTLYRGRESLDDLLAAGVRSGFGDEWLRIGGVKLLLDGTLGSQTAWLFRPYQNSDAGCGLPLLGLDELRDCVRRASAGGLACAIHAIGDRANAEALTALAEVQHLPTPLPHRVEHAQLLRRADIPRFARLGAVASMQPCHILGDIDPAERYWGRRSRWAYPARSLLRSGAILAFGSDAPVETADPITGVYAAVNRQTIDGRPPEGWYRREEGIRCLDALRAYTVGPAIASGEAELKGKLLPGHLADIVVLSNDITRRRGKSFLDAKVEFVIVGGRLKYRRRRA